MTSSTSWSRRRRPAGSGTARSGASRWTLSRGCGPVNAARGRSTAGRPGPGHAMPGRRAAAFGADRVRRAAETDRWLASLLGDEAGVALVAVGGYGRRELLPGSDLDVLLLHAGRPDISVLADRIWYPIWDSGARLDHAVRTPGEGREVARGDLRAALGLLHARHVAGDPGLTAELPPRGAGGLAGSGRRPAGRLQVLNAERTQRSGESPSCSSPTSRRPGEACGTPTRSTRSQRRGWLPGRDRASAPRMSSSSIPGTRCMR